MSEPIELSLDLKEQEYVIGDSVYVLQEASAKTAKNYKDGLAKRITFSQKNGTAQLGAHGDLEVTVVSSCLFRREGDSLVPVPENVIRSWPNRVFQILFSWVHEVSELGEKDPGEVEAETEGN